MNLLHLVIISLLILATLSECFQNDRKFDKFEEWKRKFTKRYQSSLQENKAKNQFYKNLQEIDAHNQRFDQGLESFRRGTWDRSDMSYEEKKIELTSGNRINETYTFASADAVSNPTISDFSLPTRANLKTNQLSVKPNVKHQSSLPSSVDWLAQGRVHKAVDDQVKCGCCYGILKLSRIYFQSN